MWADTPLVWGPPSMPGRGHLHHLPGAVLRSRHLSPHPLRPPSSRPQTCSQSYVFQMQAILRTCLGSPDSPGGLVQPGSAVLSSLQPPFSAGMSHFTGWSWTISPGGRDHAAPLPQPGRHMVGTCSASVDKIHECKMEPPEWGGGGETRLERWEGLGWVYKGLDPHRKTKAFFFFGHTVWHVEI